MDPSELSKQRVQVSKYMQCDIFCILQYCVSSKRKPSLQMFAPLMLSRTPGSTGKHLFAKTLTTTKTSICKVIVVCYRVNLSDGICVWNRVFRAVQESLNLSKKRDFIGSQRLFSRHFNLLNFTQNHWFLGNQWAQKTCFVVIIAQSNGIRCYYTRGKTAIFVTQKRLDGKK